jgi:hypothetical protein
MTQYDALLPVLAGVAAGASIGTGLGIVLAARSTAAVDAINQAPNYFANFVDRPLRDIPLIAWTVHAAIVVNSCLVAFGFAALPVLSARWLGRPIDWVVMAAYALAVACYLFGYRAGRRLWLERTKRMSG